jgi:hypothetical protein
MPSKAQAVAAKGLTATSWSIRGQQRALMYAQEVAHTLGRATACSSVTCARGRRSCAIMNVSYGWRFLWRSCTVTFDVYCDCASG